MIDGPFSQAKIPTELVARLEVASGPDRQIDRQIAKAIDPTIWKRATNWASMPCGAPPETIERDAIRWVPAYTESLDAALALAERVLPGWGFFLRKDNDGCNCGLVYPEASFVTPGCGTSPTPALALCIAILKAAISEDKQVGTKAQPKCTPQPASKGENTKEMGHE